MSPAGVLSMKPPGTGPPPMVVPFGRVTVSLGPMARGWPLMSHVPSARNDTGVPPQNSLAFYLALKNAGVPAELHIYEKGPHGVGLAPGDRELSTWPDRLLGWMRGRGLLN